MLGKAKYILLLLVCLNLILSKEIYAGDTSISPILVLAKQSDYGLFTAEILRAEGFNEFEVDSFTEKKITISYLKQFDIVILAEDVLSAKQRKLLKKYVKAGGNLVAFRPDKKLSPLFGIRASGSGVVAEGYISTTANSSFVKGITTEPMQFHGEADKYIITTAESIASLVNKQGVTSGFPAVVSNSYGKGRTMAFLYNLPQSIVYTRQGNYRYAGHEMDGIDGIRAMDMFTNGWVDTSKNTLNQADEQMRLLSHGIEELNSFVKPLPRFWYFPDTLKCLVTLNNDGEDSKEAEFTPQFEDVDVKGAKMTLYIKEVDLVSKEWVDFWSTKGFEISGHPDDTKQAVNPDWKTMDNVIKNLNRKLTEKFSIPAMKTVTNHWFVWCGKNADSSNNFAAQARIEELNGIELDCNYAHYDNNSNQGHFLGAFGTRQGNYTGSGLAMKFVNENGSIINVYQQLNNVYDQQYMEHRDQEGFYNCFKGLMDRSLDNGVYSLINIRAHNNEYFFSKEPLMKMLDYANNKGIPVWTELRLLHFLKTKDEAIFNNVRWKDGILSFQVKSKVKDEKLSFLVPAQFQGHEASKIISGDQQIPFRIETLMGGKYVMATILSGFTADIYVSYDRVTR